MFKSDPSVLFGTALNWKLVHLEQINSVCIKVAQATGMDSSI